MPKIPVAPQPAPGEYPAINPDIAGSAFGAAAQAAEQGSRLALYGFDVARAVQSAEDRVAALKAQNLINGDMDRTLEAFSQRIDYETFTADSEAAAKELKKKYEDTYAGNPRVWRAIEPFLESQLQDFHNTIEAKRIGLMTEDFRFQLTMSKDETQNKMASAATPEEKELYRNEYRLQVAAAETLHLITKEQGYAFVKDLDLDAERTEVINGLRSNDIKAIVRTIDKIDAHGFPTIEGADPEWLANAKMTAENRLDTLSDRMTKQANEAATNEAIAALEYWGNDIQAARKELHSRPFQIKHNLTDANGNPDRIRIEQVDTYLDGLRTNVEAAKKDTHDKYEKNLGALFLKGDYKGLIGALSSPDNPLTGDETKTWTNAVKEARKAATEPGPISPVRAAAAITWANDMIARGEDPAKVRYAIIQSPDLTKEDKEQYLNKLESKLGAELEDGRRQGYADIKAMIFPQAELTSAEGILMAMKLAPQKAASIMKAQMALDAWIDEQRKTGKSPTMSEVRLRAQQYAQAMTVTATENLRSKMGEQK